jgi:hypothetical protein
VPTYSRAFRRSKKSWRPTAWLYCRFLILTQVVASGVYSAQYRGIEGNGTENSLKLSRFAHFMTNWRCGLYWPKAVWGLFQWRNGPGLSF